MQLSLSDTLIFQPGDVDQSLVLGAAHQAMQSFLAGSEDGLRASGGTQLSECLAVKRTALQEPHHHSQQSPTQSDTLLRLPVTAEQARKRKPQESATASYQVCLYWI